MAVQRKLSPSTCLQQYRRNLY